MALMEWIGEGLSSGEIDKRALAFEQPFKVSRSQVDYYRKTRSLDLKIINQTNERKAMIEGYANKEHRVYKLSILAALMEKDLFGGVLWTHEVKSIGGGLTAEVIEFEQFNQAEVNAYLKTLESIADEMGHRIKTLSHTGKDGKDLLTPQTIVYIPANNRDDNQTSSPA